jgi:hypothetical protein
MAQINWNDEDTYWRQNFRTRPYASAGASDYNVYQPGYRYGYEAANRYSGRQWSDVETDLATGWNTYEHRGESTWEQVKDAVRDAWDRMMGRHPVGSR